MLDKVREQDKGKQGGNLKGIEGVNEVKSKLHDNGAELPIGKDASALAPDQTPASGRQNSSIAIS